MPGKNDLAHEHFRRVQSRLKVVFLVVPCFSVWGSQEGKTRLSNPHFLMGWRPICCSNPHCLVGILFH